MPDMVDGNKAIYGLNRAAWHRKGQVKPGLFTAAEALSYLNPDDEEVQKVPAFALVDGQYVMADDLEAVVDWDHETKKWRVLSYQSLQYGVVQLAEQFAFMDDVVANVDGAHYEAVVKMRKGRQVAVSINLGELILDKNGIADKTHKYLWGFNSYDGSWAMRCKFGGFRVECANMAAAALRGSSDQNVIASDWSTRHTTNVLQRVEEAKAVLGLFNVYQAEWEREAEHMIHTPIHNDAFQRIVVDLFTVDNPKTGMKEPNMEAVNETRGIYELSPTQSDLYGTVWGALQSAIEQHDHRSKVRGGRVTDVNDQRFLRQVTDPTGFKQRAWDQFWAYAQDAKKVPVS